ncbi:MAG: hypothetical protein ACI9DC_002488 [Gammaproteobacteria bacterium]|jgi:hypothetical protein
MSCTHVRTWIHVAAWLLLGALLQACAGPGDDGIGGTGITAQSDGIGGDGIGGTGISAALDPDGIGGTGIVGEITAIGSIHVAGQKVAVPQDASIQRDGHSLPAGMLAPGQVVAVLAQRLGGQLVARQILIRDALVGELTYVNGHRIDILGQQLHIADDALHLAPSLQSLSALKVGQRVRVSGLWRPGGALLVTRMEAAAPGDSDALFAPISAVDGQGLKVGGLRIRGARLPSVRPGDYVLVSGSARGSTLRARTIQVSSPIPFPEQVARVIVDGFPAHFSQREIHIGEVRATLPTTLSTTPALRMSMDSIARQGERVIVGAVVRSGAAQIRVLRPATESRPVRDVLPTPRASADKPVVPELPTLPERPVLPSRPPTLERPQPIERPQRSIDARPTDVRPLSRPLGRSVRAVR